MPTASKSPLSDDMAALARQLEVHLATLGDRVAYSSVETSPADRRPCSIGAHLDTSACLGVLTLWESGSAFFEVVAATDGRSIARRQFEDLGLEELRSVIQLFVSCVMEGGESAPPRTP
jgi:hypothetical protein